MPNKKDIVWDKPKSKDIQWDDAFQGGQPKTLPGRVIQPGMSEQQAFFEKMRSRFETPQKPLIDPGSFEKPSPLKQFLGEALPIAGDIGLTLAAPQQAGARGLSKLGNLAMRGLASAEGSYGGSLEGQQIEGGGVDTTEAGKEAAFGFVGETGIGLVGRPLKWVTEKVTKPIAMGLTAITLTAPKVTQAMKNNLVKRATERSLKFVGDLAPDVVRNQEGFNLKNLDAMVSQAVDEKKVAYNLYENILKKEAQETGILKMPKTLEFLDGIREGIKQGSEKPLSRVQANTRLRMKMGYAGQSDFNTLLDILKPTKTKSYLAEGQIEVAPEVITNLLATVFKSGSKGKGSFHGLGSVELKKLREKFKSAMLDDLSNMTARVEGKSAIEVKKEADQMTKAIAQFKFIKRLFDKATYVGKTSIETRLKPNELADSIYANKSKIQRDMPELWPALKAEAGYYKKIAKDFSETSKQGWAREGLRFAGVVGGAKFLGPAGPPIVEGMGAASAYFLMSPGGREVLKKVVYQGIAKPIAKAGVHLGGRQVNFQERGR